jgi:hypothetical membrane protein
LLRLGFIIPLIFWLTLFIGGWMREDYHHLTSLVSELGRIGTSTQYLFTLGLTICALLSVAFILALHRRARAMGISSFPVLILLPAFSFPILGAALFPLPLPLHGILGSPAMLLTASPLLALILWGRKFGTRFLIITSAILLITALGYLVFTPTLDAYPGLKQRFAHTGWTLWFVYLGWLFNKG